MDGLFRALGDENRLRIFNLLRKGELCVCELEVILGSTQSNISRHLAKLRSEGIITYQRKAQWKHYRLEQQFADKNGLLCRYLDERLDQDEKFHKDLERLTKYKNSGLTCEDKEMSNTF